MRKGIAIFLCLFAVAAFAQKDKKLVEKTVERSSIQAHLKFLASDFMKGRDTPSPELDIAAEYIRVHLEKYGVKPFPQYPDYFQPVAMKKVTKDAELSKVTVNDAKLKLNEDFVIVRGGELNVSTDFIVLDYGLPAELEGKNVDGKIVIAKAGDGEAQSPRQWFSLSGDKREAIDAAGGLGLIELYSSAQIPWPLIVNYLGRDRVELDMGEEETDNKFTVLWLNNAQGEGMKHFEGDSKSIEVRLETKVDKFFVQNVVGYVEGSDDDYKDQFVVYSAHYDHVGVGRPDSTGDGIYNGMRDNAIGTVTVLEAAKNLATYPTKRSSLFVLFAGEEKGLLGSEWFVENSPIPLDRIDFCFNSDNGGYNNTTMATVIGLDRTNAEPLLREAITSYGLTPGDDANYKDQGLFDRSDNVSFAKKGIPAPSFGMGVDQFDEELLKYYHQPADEFESVDMDYLNTFYRAYVMAGRLIGNMKEKPFWNEGDKYYEAGKELYGE